MLKPIQTSLLVAALTNAEAKLIFEDNFDEFNMETWSHEVTMGGGGNGEFQMYINDRKNSFVKDGILYIQPTLTADAIGED